MELDCLSFAEKNVFPVSIGMFGQNNVYGNPWGSLILYLEGGI